MAFSQADLQALERVVAQLEESALSLLNTERMRPPTYRVSGAAKTTLPLYGGMLLSKSHLDQLYSPIIGEHFWGTRNGRTRYRTIVEVPVEGSLSLKLEHIEKSIKKLETNHHIGIWSGFTMPGCDKNGEDHRYPRFFTRDKEGSVRQAAEGMPENFIITGATAFTFKNNNPRYQENGFKFGVNIEMKRC